MSLYGPGSALRSLAAEEEPNPSPDSSGTDDNGRMRWLMVNFHAMVWRMVRNLGVSNADVDDAVQQVFIVAFNKLTRIREGRERAFLASVAVRIASRSRRSCERRREAADSDLPEQLATTRSPIEELDRVEARRVFEVLLDRMPPELRLVFVMYEVEELTLIEIATALELPLGTVATRVRRARQVFAARAQRFSGDTRLDGGRR